MRFEFFAQFGGSFFTSQSGLWVIPQVDPNTGEVTFSPTLLTTSLTKSGRLFAGFRYYFHANQALEAGYSYSPNDLLEHRSLTGSVFRNEIQASTLAFNYVRYMRRGSR